MCRYDVTTFICGCKEWGQAIERCTHDPTEGGYCTQRRVRKRLYDRYGEGCSQHKRPTVPVMQVLPAPSPASVYKACEEKDCYLPAGHDSSHETLQLCTFGGCSLFKGHIAPHTIGLAAVVELNERMAAESRAKALRDLTLMVLSAMVMPSPDVRRIAPIQRMDENESKKPTRRVPKSNAQLNIPAQSSAYQKLDLSALEIRLFELHPGTDGPGITGSFQSVKLSSNLAYVALSYTWGDQATKLDIEIEKGETIAVGKNLWDFLRLQSLNITQPMLFWIDAICINQSNVHERNHQVNLMKQIYANAAEVIVWLGNAADNSDLAVDFLLKQAQQTLRQRGPGYHRLWTREIGNALQALCDRQYWKRMWIIQEVLHARKITVWCGSKQFDWSCIESLYLKLKTIDDTHWFAHHEFHLKVIQSAAAVIVWQRAHYRHPETPAPQLQTLVEIFRDWRCTDIRDKVFALAGMADANTSITPDYAMSTKEVYYTVVNALDRHGTRFASMLSQILGLADRDVDLEFRDLIEYKVHPPEKLVLRARSEGDWKLDPGSYW